MINDGINNVPDKTIVVFTNPFGSNLSYSEKNRLNNILDKPSKKRAWFTPHFYRCLPLVIGNQYGFVIKSEFAFSFNWNGGDNEKDIFFNFYENEEKIKNKYPLIQSHFGSGIITISPPFWLRTPPGVNLMTINPPNHVIPNITVMTGVVETDNIRRNFTFNLKIQMPNIEVYVPAGTPLAGFIPIPRYFADTFDLKFAEDILSLDLVDEEIQTTLDTEIYRKEIDSTMPNGVSRQYFRGEDVYGNRFKDHQN